MAHSDAQRQCIFRVRVLLELRAATHLHPFHGPTINALLRNAVRVGGADGASERFLIDVPEQCRVELHAGEQYAFGATLIAESGTAAAALLGALSGGLRELGRGPAPPKTALGGNFMLAELQDLVAQRTLEDDAPPQPISEEHIAAEVERLRAVDTLTLRFTSPLRAQLPAELKDHERGHAYFDRRDFPLGVFLARVMGRVRALRLRRDDVHAAKPQLPSAKMPVAGPNVAGLVKENRLVWLDVSYGPRGARKTLGGAVGCIQVELRNAEALAWLVWGQYSRVGEATAFGLGAYRIDELGPDPYACKRAVRLLELAFPHDGRVGGSSDHGTQTRPTFDAATQTILCGTHEPDPHSRIQLPKPAGGFRELSVPSARDRALQRRLAALIAPALDQFFECSSFAYRRGLGRWRAARELREAFRRGYRFALRADFRRYFDSIGHAELDARLRAYLADDEAADLLMTWVRAGAPQPGRGIPTGAPISPLIANLFLDEFDERITAEGGWLVRYADDFLILHRAQEQADALMHAALDGARDLQLTLNDEKTAQLDLNEPFDFLGFRFHKTNRWQCDAHARVLRVEDLGWFDAAPGAAQAALHLPGEQVAADSTAGPLVIFGPAAGTLRFFEGRLVCDYRDGQPSTSVAVEQVREVLLLGAISLTHRAARACAGRQINILLADERGVVFAAVSDADLVDDPDVLTAQLAASNQPETRFAIARALLVAKVRNFAALARAMGGMSSGHLALAIQLEADADRMASATTIDAMLGFEGTAAARWYSALPACVPKGFSFRRRVAPDASDPVNVLLNIAHTALYRQAALALRLIGLSPCVGVLHRPRSGHLSLASDLMEPFRHVMERVVVEALHELKPGMFRPNERGPIKLNFERDAARRFNARIYEAFEQPVIARGQESPRSYRLQLVGQARALRRRLLDAATGFAAFEHWPDAPLDGRSAPAVVTGGSGNVVGDASQQGQAP